MSETNSEFSDAPNKLADEWGGDVPNELSVHSPSLSLTSAQLSSADDASMISDNAVIAYLQAHGQIKEDNLQRAIKASESTGEPVLSVLLKLGTLSDKHFAQALSSLSGVGIIDEEAYPEEFLFPQFLPIQAFLLENKIIPLQVDEQKISIVMADPRDQYLIESLRQATDKAIDVNIGLPQEIDRYLEKAENEAQKNQEIDSFGADENDIEHLKDLANDAPVIRLVNNALQNAVEQRASDIHIEPFENRMKIRYRVDGVLVEHDTVSTQQSAAIISRIKIMAKLNIAERRLPQDGRIQFRVQGKDLDLRVSTVPTLWGESVVMRILDKEQVVLDFNTLGFERELLDSFLKVLRQPHGIILVTGPTGSGKSTTLYTALSTINSPTRKIITAEDPVEYQLEGVNQIQVKPQIGLTFAAALRSIVRQDPDIIMVGEMRDLETAQIAVQSALTGHLVLSTLHTNDAPSSINRLIDMGVNDYMITTTVIGVLAQRLVRQLCEHCKVPKTLSDKVYSDLQLDRLDLPENYQFYDAAGCGACGQQGYRGRLAITEFMAMNDSIRQTILSKATSQELSRVAREGGMKNLYDDGLMKAARGKTTIEEVIRVTQDV